MKLDHDSWLVKWTYSPPIWDTPYRESLCVLFWRALAVPVVWVGVVLFFVSIALLPGIAYTVLSWAVTAGVLTAQGVDLPEDGFWPGTFWWDTTQTIVVSAITWGMVYLHEEHGWFGGWNGAPGPEIRSPTPLKLAVLRAKAAKRKVCPIIEID